jgi:hypothetical protein
MADKMGRQLQENAASFYHKGVMPFPIRVCTVCGEEFELKPDKPGFANRCPSCSEPEESGGSGARGMQAGDSKSASELNQARKHAIRDLLYRKDS